MNQSMKAALISALVFPGAGHFYLKEKLGGFLFAVPAFGALFLIISTMMEKAQLIVGQIQRGEIQPDIIAITELLTRHAAEAGSSLQVVWIAFIVVWLGSTVDAYRLGRKAERNTPVAT